ncbi:hypothetical protein C8F04DRAFT_1090427 [Mycena alexandri]|uniref:Uncharacterized protein n=1 Tax=Mycena alexandri TaxID=1745969 RepID=A0AAD6T4W1_9AGAR|nr:hypothetical protein C8F04DRAFT_1090427 [Mycena alexandri]
MHASLHPYLHSALRTSRSSQDFTARPPPQESYSLRSLSDRHLPATLAVQQPPAATLSLQHLPASPPSPSIGPCSSETNSANSSVEDFDLPGAPPWRRSVDVTPHSITENTYSIHSLSVQHLPAPSHHPPAIISVSRDFGPGGHFPSTNPDVVDIHVSVPGIDLHSADVAEPSSNSPPQLRAKHPCIFPGTPESVRRYDRNAIVPDKPTQFTLRPGSHFTRVPAPPGWTFCLHPEGAPYFFHEEMRVFTDAKLFDGATLQFINVQIDNIFNFLRAHDIELKPGVDLVLEEYVYPDEIKGCQYYFVDHQDRSVFWMDEVEATAFTIAREVNGLTAAAHIRHILQVQYWNHCELFPKSLKLTHAILDELRDIVLFARGDLTTSPTSTVEMTIDDLREITNIIDGFARNIDRNVSNPFSGSSSLVGRLMSLFVSWTIYNHHGEVTARLDSNHSVYGTIRKPTPLIKLMGPLLFYAPSHHLENLHATYTDGIIRIRGWSDFIEKLTSEWRQFTLDAAVILNANVGFLSIQSVDQSGYLVLNRSPAQLASYLSILSSIGSIMFGLLLVKQYRNREKLRPADASQFMFNYRSELGLEKLAILYSLPYAMLMWSTTLFCIAFSLMCFQWSSFLTRTLVGIISLFIGGLLFWCIVMGWQGTSWGWPKHFLNSERWGRLKRPFDTKDKVDLDTDSAGGVSNSTTLVPRRKWSSLLTRKMSRRSDQSVV